MYPSDILSTRAVIKRGYYAIVPPTGLVNNVVPGISNCRVSIVASPKMGASFVQYIIEAEAQKGGTSFPFAAVPGVEALLYVISAKGNVSVTVGGETKKLTGGGYAFSPPGAGISFLNESDGAAKIVLYKQRHVPLTGQEPTVVFGNVNSIPYRIYDDMENVLVKDLLPTDLGFDMNFHILSFIPGGCHPFVETHVQEHGAYILSGEGAYYLGDDWTMIRKEDFVWFGPYCPQAAYGVGRENFTYIYSKDCNRDVEI